VIVVADSTKFGRTCLSHLSELGKAHVLVTDGDIRPHWQQALSEAGVRLVVAQSPAGTTM
jgi:DeoR/GlpR family transcriptional regulator of sugar metabolism